MNDIVQPKYLEMLESANAFVGDPENWKEETLTELLSVHRGLIGALRAQIPSLVEATRLGVPGFSTVAFGCLTTCFLIGYYAAKSEQPQYKN